MTKIQNAPARQKLEALHRFLGLEFPRQKKTIGVVFGKFYPLHTGHIYLIQRACSQVDELHIIMGFDDTRDRALFEDSAMSQHAHRRRIVCAGYTKLLNIKKNIRIHVFQTKRAWSRIRTAWDVWRRTAYKKFYG